MEVEDLFCCKEGAMLSLMEEVKLELRWSQLAWQEDGTGSAYVSVEECIDEGAESNDIYF